MPIFDEETMNEIREREQQSAEQLVEEHTQQTTDINDLVDYDDFWDDDFWDDDDDGPYFEDAM